MGKMLIFKIKESFVVMAKIALVIMAKMMIQMT
jgi:hypothetical protein